MENFLTSTVVERQLPSFVRDEHPTFVLFIKKYYEWLETNNQVHAEINELRNSFDIDTSSSFYIDKLKQDLMPYFPQEIVANKKLFLKLVTNFYKASGTPDSIKFLFRALYNENIDIYYPKEDILKASDGKWVLPLALRIDTNDNNIFNIENTLLTGQTSKATALVEKVIRSVDRQLGITYIEVYVSNVERLFATGETVTATYNNGTTDITATGRLVGALSEIKIDPKNRGLYYTPYDPVTGYPGDPVTLVGGFSDTSLNPIGAVAYVGTTTSGGITDIRVVNGGFGFRKYDPLVAYSANTGIIDFKGGFESLSLAQITEAKASINLLDTQTVRLMNVSSMSIETMNSIYGNTNTIYSSTILSISSFQSFNVYPISFVTVDGGGGGYRSKPTVETFSFYNESNPDTLIITSATVTKDTKVIVDNTQNLTNVLEKGDYVRLAYLTKFEDVYEVAGVTTNTITFYNNFTNDLSGVSVYKMNRNDLYKIGSIGRITVSNPGENYANGETIIFTGGSGYGANAYIEVYSSNGGIKSVTVNAHSQNAYVIGGEGYRRDALPTLTVDTASGANAVLAVSEITGDGESYDLTTSRIGAITSLRIISYGYDYIQAPSISLRNMDIVVANVTEGALFVSNTTVYQGTSNVATTFRATVDTYVDSTGFLRLFDYSGTLDKTKLLISDDGEVQANVSAITVIYGDGKAKATAKFENGLIRYPGIYLNTDGQLSADKKLQDAEKYHNFSYVIKTKTDYNKFKKPLADIVHPVGTKTFVTRIEDNEQNITIANTATTLSTYYYFDTMNIAYSANTIVSTNVSANLQQTINVGDTIILESIHRTLQNTVNVVSGSNVIFGANGSVNFINDLMDGDSIYLSTGNTTTIKEVVNSTHAILNTAIGVTSTSATMNLIYDEVVVVTSVNANTIITNTTFDANGYYLDTKVQKIR